MPLLQYNSKVSSALKGSHKCGCLGIEPAASKAKSKTRPPNGHHVGGLQIFPDRNLLRLISNPPTCLTSRLGVLSQPITCCAIWMCFQKFVAIVCIVYLTRKVAKHSRYTATSRNGPWFEQLGHFKKSFESQGLVDKSMLLVYRIAVVIMFLMSWYRVLLPLRLPGLTHSPAVDLHEQETTPASCCYRSWLSKSGALHGHPSFFHV